MITRTKQNWTPGHSVKVGFLTLMVVACIHTPGDGLPDVYLLASKSAFYRFTPHMGLVKLDVSEAKALAEDARRQVEATARNGLEAQHRQALQARLILDWTIAA